MRRILSLLCAVVALSSCQNEDHYSTIDTTLTMDVINNHLTLHVDLNEAPDGIVQLQLNHSNDAINSALTTNNASYADIVIKHDDANLIASIESYATRYDGEHHYLHIDASSVTFDADKAYKIIPITLHFQDHVHHNRTVLIIVNRSSSSSVVRSTSLSDDLKSTYANFIGMSTRRYMGLGNVVTKILDFDKLLAQEQYAQSGDYFLSTNGEGETMYEHTAMGFGSTMSAWSLDVGVSCKHPGFGGTMVASFDFGVSKSTTKSKGYEYYINHYQVNKREGTLQSSLLFMGTNRPEPSEALLYFTSQDIFRELSHNSFDARAFLDDHGTDIITQGVFGGSYVNLYLRKENAYEQSVSYDYSASVSRKSAFNKSNTLWLDIYKMKNPNFFTGTVSGTHEEDDYYTASDSQNYTKMTGGDSALDPADWIKGFNDTDANLTLVRYRRSSDREDEDKTYAMDIEEYFLNVITAYENYMLSLNDGVLDAVTSSKISIIKSNIAAIGDAKAQYLLDNAAAEQERKPLILAAFKMVAKSSNSDTYKNPVPYVADAPKNPGVKIVYYPLRANAHAPEHTDYALETSSDKFVVCVDSSNHHWYYALSTADEVAPIYDIEFLTESEAKDRGYSIYGNHANSGLGVSVSNRYVSIQYLDTVAHPDWSPITSVGLIYDDKTIIASSAGSELPVAPTTSESNFFNSFWATRSTSQRSFIDGGFWVATHKIRVVTNTEDIGYVNESNTYLPYKW